MVICGATFAFNVNAATHQALISKPAINHIVERLQPVHTADYRWPIYVDLNLCITFLQLTKEEKTQMIHKKELREQVQQRMQHAKLSQSVQTCLNTQCY